MPVYTPGKRLKDIEMSSLEESIIEEYDNIDYDKMKVECLCPKCGKKHVMNFHWIGRGTPRKFCQFCKS